MPEQPETAMTLYGALLRAVRRFGRKTPDQWLDLQPSAATGEPPVVSGRHSYGDLLRMTLALGRLAGRLTGPDEHVGVLMPNLTATVALLIGLSARGRVPCMLNYTAGQEGLQSACRLACIRTVISSRRFLEKAELMEQVMSLQDVRLVFVEDLRGQFGWLDKLWLMGFALWLPALAMPRGNPDAAAVVLFTSGSEGKPKGVVLSHRALLANAGQVMQVLRFDPGHRVLNALPIFHSFGLTAGTFIPLVSGARLVFYPTPLHFKVIPKIVHAHGCTVLFSTGTFLGHYARNAAADDLRSLRCVVAGAEKLAEPIRQLWREKFGIDILEGYGATETAPVLAVNRPEDNRPGSVGRLLPEIDARLIPVEGIVEGGELHVRGPNLMSGYYRFEAPGMLEETASVVGPGWHNTGDVVTIDADGYVHIQGRLKRFAKVAGEMVSLEVSETIARAASPDALHGAVALQDPERGESIVLLTTDPQLNREQLVAAARSLGLPEIAVPRRTRCVETLPLLGSGKVDYQKLREMAVQS